VHGIQAKTNSDRRGSLRERTRKRENYGKIRKQGMVKQYAKKIAKQYSI
jgi:hypothetical protein